MSPVPDTEDVETTTVEIPWFRKLSEAGIGEVKSSGKVTVVVELPGRVSVLEIVNSVEVSEFTPVIKMVTLETVSEVALKFSRTISRVTGFVAQSS